MRTSLHETIFGSLCVLAVACAAASLTWPLGYDHGILAWVGSVILDGGAPYRDAWETKGPMAHLLYAFVQLVFGHNAWGIRVVDVVLVALAAAVLWRYVRHVAGALAARWAAVLFVLWYFSGTFYATAQPDGWAMLALVIVLVPSDPDWPLGRRRALVSGLVLGAVTLIKPLYALFAPLALLARATHRRKLDLSTVAVFATAYLVPLIAVPAWLLYLGAFDEFVEVYFVYNASVYSAAGEPCCRVQLESLVETFVRGSVISVALPAMLVGVLDAYRRDRTAFVFWSGWFLLSLGIVIAQAKYFTYHWLPIYPPVVVLASRGLWVLLESSRVAEPPTARAGGVAVRLFAVASIALIVANASMHAGFETLRFLAFATGSTDIATYTAGFTTPGPDREAARYIEKNSAPGDRVMVWGWNLSIVYLSRRQAASRFNYAMPLVLGPGTEALARNRAEYLRDVARNPPRYVVENSDLTNIFGVPASLDAFPEFERIVASEYEVVYEADPLIIHERRDRGRASALRGNAPLGRG